MVDIHRYLCQKADHLVLYDGEGKATAVDHMKGFVDDDICHGRGKDFCIVVNHVANLVSNLDLDFGVCDDRRGLAIDCGLCSLSLQLISVDHKNVENFDGFLMSRVGESVRLTAVASR